MFVNINFLRKIWTQPYSSRQLTKRFCNGIGRSFRRQKT